MARFASYHRFRRQDGALVVHWRRVILAHGVRGGRPNLNVHVSKPSHHRIHIEVVRLSASEGWHLLLLLLLLVLPMEESFSFLSGLVLEGWALLVPTDVLLNHLLFLLVIFLVTVACIGLHATLHRRELPVQIDRRLALIVQSTEALRALVIAVTPILIAIIVCSDFEILTCSKLLRVSARTVLGLLVALLLLHGHLLHL